MANAVRGARRLVKVSSDERDMLYNVAFSRTMTKSGQDSSTGTGNGSGQEQGLGGIVTSALVGSLLGGGLGILTNYTTPLDEQESRSKRFWRHVLGGMALGGVAGAGAGYLGLPQKAVDAVASITNPADRDNRGPMQRVGRLLDETTGPALRTSAGYGLGWTAGKTPFWVHDVASKGWHTPAYTVVPGYTGGNSVNLNPIDRKQLGSRFSTPYGAKDYAASLIKNKNNTGSELAQLERIAKLDNFVQNVKNPPSGQFTVGNIRNLTNAAINARVIPGLTWVDSNGIIQGSADPALNGKRLVDVVERSAKNARRAINGVESMTSSPTPLASSARKWVPRSTGVLGAILAAVLAPSASSSTGGSYR